MDEQEKWVIDQLQTTKLTFPAVRWKNIV